MKHKIQIKPLSINQAWQGRRYKTPAYNYYEKAVKALLPNIKIPSGRLEVIYEVGFSNPANDIDNFLKLFQDILQKKYKFNDNMIYRLTITKKIVKKGQEYISFEIRRMK